MSEAVISTLDAHATPDGRAVAVVATLDAGAVEPGMFVHVPLNGMLNVTFPVHSVTQVSERCIKVTLDCDNDADSVNLVLAFFGGEQTLWVRSEGEA